MWGEEAHLPGWPSGPADGVAVRSLRAAWRAIRRTAAAGQPLAYDAAPGRSDQQWSAWVR